MQQFTTHPGGPPALLHALEILATSAKAAGTATAFGEIGLDYDRLYHATKEDQLTYFAAQLEVAVKVQLPLFLHSRAAAEDFERLLVGKLGDLPRRGLVHSFTGTVGEMERLVAIGFHIGVNGCSLKTEENLEVVRRIPLDRLQLETDGPWVSLEPLGYVLILTISSYSCPSSFLILEFYISWPFSQCKTLSLTSHLNPTVRDPALSRLLRLYHRIRPSREVSQERKTPAW